MQLPVTADVLVPVGAGLVVVAALVLVVLVVRARKRSDDTPDLSAADWTGEAATGGTARHAVPSAVPAPAESGGRGSGLPDPPADRSAVVPGQRAPDPSLSMADPAAVPWPATRWSRAAPSSGERKTPDTTAGDRAGAAVTGWPAPQKPYSAAGDARSSRDDPAVQTAPGNDPAPTGPVPVPPWARTGVSAVLGQAPHDPAAASAPAEHTPRASRPAGTSAPAPSPTSTPAAASAASPDHTSRTGDRAAAGTSPPPPSNAGSGRTVAAAVAQAFAVRAAASRVGVPEHASGDTERPPPRPQPAQAAQPAPQTPPGVPRGDARDQLLAVLLDDPVRAVGATMELQACRSELERLSDAVRHEQAVIRDVLYRLANTGLRPEQLARLAGLPLQEVQALLAPAPSRTLQ